MMNARILTPGRLVYAWPRSEHEWPKFEPTPAFFARLRTHDLTGLIVHSVCPVPDSMTEASEWCTPERVAAFNAAGFVIVIGVGMRAPPFWERMARDIIQAIDACKRPNSPCAGVNCDWEGSHDGHKAEAKLLLAMILEAHPDAGRYLTMPCWWAPEELPNGNATHPRAPTKEWLDVIAADVPIDPQCYGAGGPEGASKGMLAWARKQYATHYGLPPWRVVPSLQMYHRTLFDHVDLLLSEETVALWDLLEADAVCLHAMRISYVLRSGGIHGPNWVTAFQALYGLKADGIAGPLTKAALEKVCA